MVKVSPNTIVIFISIKVGNSYNVKHLKSTSKLRNYSVVTARREKNFSVNIGQQQIAKTYAFPLVEGNSDLTESIM